jgi:hypothetical protein
MDPLPSKPSAFRVNKDPPEPGDLKRDHQTVLRYTSILKPGEPRTDPFSVGPIQPGVAKRIQKTDPPVVKDESGS